MYFGHVCPSSPASIDLPHLPIYQTSYSLSSKILELNLYWPDTPVCRVSWGVVDLPGVTPLGKNDTPPLQIPIAPHLGKGLRDHHPPPMPDLLLEAAHLFPDT